MPAAEFRKSVVREYFESLVIAATLALFIRTFVVQAFKIPTGSMETNLLVGDHLLVNKMIYSPSAGAWEDRLLPEETVEIRNKTVYINGQALDESRYVTFLEAPLLPSDPEYGVWGDERKNWGPQTVPPARLLGPGDN